MRRRGVSSLLLALMAVTFLFLWGMAQQFVTTSTRRKVKRAEWMRTAVVMSTNAAEQGVAWLETQANTTLDPDRPGEGVSVAEQLRDIRAGDTLEFPYHPPWLTSDPRARLDAARGLAHVHEIIGEDGERPDEVDCEHLVPLEQKRRRGEPLTPEEQAEWDERMGGYLPGEAHGVVDLQATARVSWDRRPMFVEATVRQAFVLRLSPCPELYAEDPGQGWGSYFHTHPVELGRWMRVHPGPAAVGEEDA